MPLGSGPDAGKPSDLPPLGGPPPMPKSLTDPPKEIKPLPKLEEKKLDGGPGSLPPLPKPEEKKLDGGPGTLPPLPKLEEKKLDGGPDSLPPLPGEEKKLEGRGCGTESAANFLVDPTERFLV